MSAKGWWQRLRESEEGRVLRRLAVLAVAAPVVWMAVRFSFWLVTPDSLLINRIVTYSGTPASFGFWEMKQLLAWGADANYIHEGRPVLIEAAVWGDVEIVELLLSHGAELNATSDAGATALDTACFYDHRHLIAYLKAHNAEFSGVYSATYDGRPLPPGCR